MKTINQKIIFKATPEEVYEMLMDSKKHSKFTGSKAKIGKKVGDKLSVYDGGLHGINIEIIPNKKIVQKWQCSMKDWPKTHYSKVSFSFKKIKEGTSLTFIQTGVPDKCASSINKGWKDYYWNPMKKMLNK